MTTAVDVLQETLELLQSMDPKKFRVRLSEILELVGGADDIQCGAVGCVAGYMAMTAAARRIGIQLVRLGVDGQRPYVRFYYSPKPLPPAYSSDLALRQDGLIEGPVGICALSLRLRIGVRCMVDIPALDNLFSSRQEYERRGDLVDKSDREIAIHRLEKAIALAKEIPHLRDDDLEEPCLAKSD